MILPLSNIVSPLRRPLISASAPALTAFLTGSGSGGPRGDSQAGVGFSFVVGAANITVTQLGRWIISGNSGMHTITLYSGRNVSTDALGSATVNASGAPSSAFLYAALGSPITLTAGGTYYILSSETVGDQWLDESVVPSTSDATVQFAEFNGGGTITPQLTGEAYVPPNFKYHL